MKKRSRPSRGASKTKTLNRRMGKDGERITADMSFSHSFMLFCKRNRIPTIGLMVKRRVSNV